MKILHSPNAKKLALLGGIAVVALLLADPSFANGASFNANGKTIGSVASNVTTSIKGVGVLVTACCYLGALLFGVIGVTKWQAYAEQPDRTPLKIPIMFWGIAVMLAGFPEFMGTGIASLWGSGASLVSEPN